MGNSCPHRATTPMDPEPIPEKQFEAVPSVDAPIVPDIVSTISASESDTPAPEPSTAHGTFYFMSGDTIDVEVTGTAPFSVLDWKRAIHRELNRRMFGDREKQLEKRRSAEQADPCADEYTEALETIETNGLKMVAPSALWLKVLLGEEILENGQTGLDFSGENMYYVLSAGPMPARAVVSIPGLRDLAQQSDEEEEEAYPRDSDEEEDDLFTFVCGNVQTVLELMDKRTYEMLLMRRGEEGPKVLKEVMRETFVMQLLFGQAVLRYMIQETRTSVAALLQKNPADREPAEIAACEQQLDDWRKGVERLEKAQRLKFEICPEVNVEAGLPAGWPMEA